MSAYDPQSQCWVANFFLNSLLRGAYQQPIATYMYNYVRRAEHAFREHGLAREATLKFIEGGRQSPSQYARALHHWEVFLGQAWHAYQILGKCFGFTIFERGSGALEERLNALYNQMKHVESRIAAAQIPADATVPVWLTNEGLRSTDTAVTFPESAEILKDIANVGECILRPAYRKGKVEHA